MMMCVWWMVLVMTLGGRGLAREPRPMCPPDAKNCVSNEENNKTYFVINGTQLKYEFTDGDFFAFQCPRGITLDEPGLPRFEPALQVREVRLTCSPPAAASYEAALSALNVTALEVSSHDTTQAPPTYSIKLQLDAIRNFNAKLLAVSPALRELIINNTELTVDDLALLPAGLQSLKLYETGISLVPAKVLMRLPALVNLYVNDVKPVKVEAAGNLSSLYINSALTNISLTLPDSLQELNLFHWAELFPEPWLSCTSLDRLRLFTIATETLPDGWLAWCGRLRTLVVHKANNLKTLAAGVLRGATALQVVHFSYGSLEALPAGLFEDARALRELNLGGNSLHTLPGDLFRHTQFLSKLDLTSNQLNQSVLGILGDVTSLNVLLLDFNPELDGCPETRDHGNTSVQVITWTGSSALETLKNLTVLSLGYTNTTRICPDWRQLPRLQEFNFYNIDTTTPLKFTDLWFNNTINDIRVGLNDMNLLLRREEYNILTTTPSMHAVTLNLVSAIRCDCDMYWAAAVLRHPNTSLSEQGARCKDKGTLSDVPLSDFVCPAPGHCPKGCSCGVREDIALTGRVLKIDCANNGLRSVPHVDTGPEPFAVDLRLARNRISRLSPDILPPRLVVRMHNGV